MNKDTKYLSEIRRTERFLVRYSYITDHNVTVFGEDFVTKHQYDQLKEKFSDTTEKGFYKIPEEPNLGYNHKQEKVEFSNPWLTREEYNHLTNKKLDPNGYINKLVSLYVHKRAKMYKHLTENEQVIFVHIYARYMKYLKSIGEDITQPPVEKHLKSFTETLKDITRQTELKYFLDFNLFNDYYLDYIAPDSQIIRQLLEL